MPKSAVVAFAAALTMLAGSASATVVLDQASVPEEGVAFALNAGGLVPSNAPLGQSFTVGVTGVLDHIDIGLFTQGGASANPVTIKLLNNSGGVLLSRDYDAATVPALSLGGTLWQDLFRFDVSSANVQVTAGQILKWSIYSPGQYPHVSIIYQDDNSTIQYAGGDALTFYYGPTGHPFTTDFAFRTYVDDGLAGVPEPSTWGLMLLGFGLGGTALRTRRRSVPA